jgi:hypothetical protein
MKVMQSRHGWDNDYYRDQIRFQVITQGVFLILLVVEAIIYWRIRKRSIRKDLAWLHIGGMLLAFVVIPIFFSVFVAWQGFSNSSGDARSTIVMISTINRYVMWAAIIIGHIGFVMVLINAYKKRTNETDPNTTDGPDILNDYA